MAAKVKPYWYRLINLFKSEGEITTGLTIPFIFGAYKVLEHPFSNIDELVDSVLNSELDKYPVIQKCNEINHHVIMLEDKKICNKEYIKDVKIKSEKCGNILFISSNTNLGEEPKRVCWELTQQYEAPIKRGEFSWSKQGNIWRKFSEKEIELIKRIK